jgi:AcrR family transcriptional regulator
MQLPKFFSDTAASLAHKRERRKEARPGELLDAALNLFVEKGFAATRMEEVAKRAGVSKGTVFLYFPSKEELFKAVVRENISGRFEEWHAELLTYEGSAADMLQHCMTTWWQHIGSTQASGITKLMISEGSHFPDIVKFYQDEVVQPGHALIRQVLQRGIDRGEFRAIHLDFAVYGVVAAMQFLIMSKHSSACLPNQVSLDPDAYIANQVALMLQGLGANQPSGVKTGSSS